MPNTSKETASETIAMEGFECRYENLEGGYTVGFETYTSDADLADFFRGLPDDRCQCPHWGYVISGKLTFTYPTAKRPSAPGTPTTRRQGTHPSCSRKPRSSSSARPTRSRTPSPS